VYSALQRNNYLAAVGQTKGNLVQVSLLADTDLRTVEEFERLIVRERDGAIVRLGTSRASSSARRRPTSSRSTTARSVYLGVWPLVGANEIEVADALRAEMARIEPNAAEGRHDAPRVGRHVFMRDALREITKTLIETIAIVGLVVFLFLGSVRTALVPLVAMPVSLIGAAAVMSALGFSLNLLTILAIVLSVGLVVDDAIVVVENVARHVRIGQDAHPGRARRRARAARARSSR
jgi:multidrug efflux pump